MVLSQMKNWLNNATNAVRECLQREGSTRRNVNSGKLKRRHLVIDPLEDRNLLSLSVATADDVLVNTDWQDIRGDISMATNEAGDVIVAWTAADPVYDPASIDNGTNRQIDEDLNVYARYLTNEVQRIVLSDELAPTGSTGTGGAFQLVHNSAEVQRITFTSATEDSLLYGTINIGLWIDNELTWGYKSGAIDEGYYFTFDESLSPSDNAASLQTYLRTNSRFLGRYSKVEVTAVSAREYDIAFYGSSYAGKNLQELQIKDCNFVQGYMGGAISSTVMEPTTVTGYSETKTSNIGIIVSSDPWVTASRIQAAFNQTLTYTVFSPVTRSWVFDEASHMYVYEAGTDSTFRKSDAYGGSTDMYAVEVTVLPVTIYNETTGRYELSKTQFDITFVGNSGLQDQQPLSISSMISPNSGTNLVASPTSQTSFSVTTLKENSPVFRVNSPEPATYVLNGDGSKCLDDEGDPIVQDSGKLDQAKPVVTMDNDGEFTVVWQSEVNDITQPRNTYDIYARRFTVQGVTTKSLYDEKVGFYVDGGVLDLTQSSTYTPQANLDPYQLDVGTVAQAQGVRPLAEEFLVNVTTNGGQTDPSISSDLDGNFVVSWTTDAQWNSYFAGIYARWFDKTGLAITGEVAVTQQQASSGTPIFGPSYVAVSPEGYAVVLYNQSGSLYKSVYGIVESTEDANSKCFASRQLVSANAYGGSVDFDSNGRYIISYTRKEGGDQQNTLAYVDSFAVGYAITIDSNLAYSETNYLPTFEVNSNGDANSYYGSDSTLTKLDQGKPSVGVDADGDIFVSYQGFGMDVSFVEVLSEDARGGFVPLYSYGVYSTMNLIFQNNLCFFNRAVTYEGTQKIAYEGKNDDLLGTDEKLRELREAKYTNYDDPLLYTEGILYQALAYACGDSRNAIDTDTFVRAAIVGAAKAGATTEQQARVVAILNFFTSNLSGASNDILYSTFNNGGNQETGSYGGVVNNYRDGSNSRFYIYVPRMGREDGTVTIQLVCQDRFGSSSNGAGFTVSFDVPLNDNNVLADPESFRRTIQSAFNSVDGFSDYSFYVQNVTSLVGDWVGTAYELPGVYAQVQGGYVVYEVVCQCDAHDTPYVIYPGQGHSSYTYTVIDADDATTVYSGFFYQQQVGSFGTKEINSQVAMTNSGDVVVGWQQYSTSTAGVYDTAVNVGHPVSTKTSQIFLRTFKESTDNAGPIVTQVALPDGSRVEEGQTVTSTVKNLVVSFDENLMTKVCGYNSAHSVDNLANWVLLCDGVETANAIESISFGMSASRSLALDSVNPAVNGGTLALGSNKWEAVITFKDGYELTTGNYTLIAKCNIQDVAGNALYAQGLNFPATDYEINFSIISLNTPLAFDTEDSPYISHYVPEIVVSDPSGNSADSEILTNPSVLDNITRRDVLDEESSIFETPGNPNSVASDANGNFVVVWTSSVDPSVITEELAADTGVWVKIYRQEYVMDANGKRTYVTDVIKEFKIEDTAAYQDESGQWHFASQASVALNDKGDFVVVWDQYNAETESRDVYARRYTLMGKEIGINGGLGNFMVNKTEEEDQQNASVAMDADGDFVIVWESFGQDYEGQDTWGIYGRRFTNDGYSFGITNTQQTLTIGGNVVTGTYFMKLKYTDEAGVSTETEYIPIAVETARNATEVKNALLKLKDRDGNAIFEPGDLNVTALASNQIMIAFAGRYANQPIDLLTAASYKNTGTPESPIYTRTSVVTVNINETSSGSSGSEFLVNDTVENHQRYPSIAMDSVGGFIVSWTAWGSANDVSYETNIYAKRYVANSYLQNTASYTNNFSSISGADNGTDLIITTNEETLNTNAGDASYTGVCYIYAEAGNASWSGTGTLLPTGLHVLTAAHVVSSAGVAVAPSTITVTFEFAGAQYVYLAEEIYIHTDFTGDTSTSPDIAIIQLTEQVAGNIERYDIYRNSDEIGQIFTTVGYGLYGLATEEDPSLREDNEIRKHWGQNQFELTGNQFNGTYISSQLVFDFDDGTVANDYIGNNYGWRDLGLKNLEVGTAQGDSGGPAFINGKIAGVTSWGYSASDYGSEYGDCCFDVRVSAYVDWIDAILDGGIGSEFLVNANDGAPGSAAYADNESGYQIWSSVALDDSGNFVVTWTSYNQDGHGDAMTGATRNGLGGIYARRYHGSEEYGDNVFLVNDFTEKDQVASQVSMDRKGNFVIVWESFKDRENLASDIPDSFGIYAKRYVNTNDYFKARVTAYTAATPGATWISDAFPTLPRGIDSLTIKTIGVVGIDGEYGSEFCVENVYLDEEKQRVNTVNQSLAGDQLAGSVALNGNGDMVFVWTNLGVRTINTQGQVTQGSEVYCRSVTLADDDTPPTVTRVDAICYDVTELDDNDEDESNDVSVWAASQQSLFDGYDFGEGEAPTEIKFTFSEVMFSEKLVEKIKEVNKTIVRSASETEREYQARYAAAILEVLNEQYKKEGSQGKSILDISNWSLLRNGYEVFAALYVGLEYQYEEVDLANDPNDYNEESVGTYVLTIGFYETDEDGNPVQLTQTKTDEFGNTTEVPVFEVETDEYGNVILDAEGNPVYKLDAAGEKIPVIKSSLSAGSYVLTLKDAVTDLFGNKLDGDYDGIAGGSFNVRFTVAGSTDVIIDPEDPDAPTGEDAGDGVVGSNLTLGHNDPDSVSWIDPDTGLQHFIIVVTTERLIEDGEDLASSYKLVTDPHGTTTSSGTGTGTTTSSDTTEYALVTDIVLREYVEDATGTIVAAGSEVVVSGASGSQYDPSIAATTVGNYVIAWNGAGDSAVNGVYANFYMDGQVYTRFVSSPGASCTKVKVEISGETVMIAWVQGSSTENSRGDKVMARLYDIKGTALSDEFVFVDEYTNSIEAFDLSADRAGNIGVFGVSWNVLYPDNMKNPSDIFMRTYHVNDLMSASYAAKRNAYSVSQRVNSVEFGQQNDSQITMDNNGNMYVTWTSSAYNEIDVYARAYYLDGTARLFNGSMIDTKINTVTPHKQWHSDIAVSPDGGRVLVTWQSHDAEGSNYNALTGEEMKDYGVCARLFNCSSGVSINPISGANKADEWVVNTIHNGDQERPTCTVFSGTSIRFVVAWVGPNTLIPTTLDETASSIVINGDDYDTIPGFYQVFLKYYPYTKFGMSTYSDQSISAVTTKALAMSYSMANDTTGTSYDRGYYNPSGSQVAVRVTVSKPSDENEAVDPSHLVLTGTTGNDRLVVTSSTTGLSITLNGTVISLASGIKTIQFSGMGGYDTVVVNGSSANESIVVNGIGSSVKYSLYSGSDIVMSLSASSIQAVELSSGGGYDSLSVVTSKGRNEVTFAPEEISIVSNDGFNLTATNFKEAVVSSIVGTDVAYVKGSDEDEELHLANGYARFVSGDCDYQLSGFSSIEANGGGGYDFVRADEIRYFNSVPLFVVANTDSTSHIMSDFEYVTLNGSDAAVGQIRGSKSSDSLVAGLTSGRFTYSMGNVVAFNNVNALTVDGNGGVDSALLYTEGKQKSVFIGQEKTASLTQGLYSKTLNNFERVVVQGSAASTDVATLYDTSLSDTLTADDNSATLTSGKTDLYVLLAFDQVTAKKDRCRGNDTLDISDAIDFVLEKSEWEKV